MKFNKILTSGILIGIISSNLFASKEITICSGGKNGNYYKVAQDIVDYCGEEIKKKYGYKLVNVSTTGSVYNLNGLLKKKCSIGFVQSDVYKYFKKRDTLDLLDVKTKKMMKLYPEYLHILIPKNWKPNTNSNNSFFNKFKSLFSSKQQNKPISISIYSLKNQTVFAKGGAIVSAQALSYFLGLNLHVVNASKFKKVNEPFIFVTGNGDNRIEKMLKSGRWFLLSFNPNELSNRVDIYKPAVLTYIVNGKTITVKTVSIMSNMYSRKYRGKKKIKALKDLKICIKNNIDELIDDGNSDKWSLIGITNGWISDDENK